MSDGLTQAGREFVRSIRQSNYEAALRTIRFTFQYTAPGLKGAGTWTIWGTPGDAKDDIKSIREQFPAWEISSWEAVSEAELKKMRPPE